MESVAILQNKHQVVLKIVDDAGRIFVIGDDSEILTTRNIIDELLGIMCKDALRIHEGSFDAAESEEALQICRDVKESFHTLHQPNEFLVDQKKISEALNIYGKLHETTEEKFGIHHPSTLMTGNDIGVLLAYQEKYDEALVILKDNFDISKEMLGHNHRTTVDLQNNLAYVQDKKGEYDAALCNYSEMFEILKHHLHKDDCIMIRQHIASLQGKIGKYEESMSIYRDIENHYEKCRNDLVNKNKKCIAGILSQQGKFDETLKIYDEVLEYEKSVFGPEHLFALTTESSRSLVYMQQGRYPEALKTYKIVWKIQKNITSLDNPVVLSTQNNIAVAYFCLEEFDKAEMGFEDTSEKLARVLGPDHTLTKMCKLNYSFAVARQEYSKALKMLEEVQKKMTNLGSFYPDASVIAQKIQSLTVELEQLSIDVI